ncbi:thiaminase II [Bacillus tianshenii]|nr:thiaminase II [Bacillus tianshenii]
MNFTTYLHEKARPIWRQYHEHPFVKGIGNGTLQQEKFRFFMVQDYLYLIEYAKLFAVGTLKAKDIQTMQEFTKLQDAILNGEMELHRKYAAQFGITASELENAKPSPIMLAYSHYMLSVSQSGSIADLIAALLPCVWSYAEIGQKLNQIPGAADNEDYGEWVKMYASEEFDELSVWLKDKLDELTDGMAQQEKDRLEEIFLNTSRFEYMFWDMVYNEEMWPLDA